MGGKKWNKCGTTAGTYCTVRPIHYGMWNKIFNHIQYYSSNGELIWGGFNHLWPIWQYRAKIRRFWGLLSQSSLAVRFTAKNGGYPGDGKLDHERHKNGQIGATICPGPRETCQNFFVGGIFLEVITQIYWKGDNCSICGPVSFFVRWVIWHREEEYNCNIM